MIAATCSPAFVVHSWRPRSKVDIPVFTRPKGQGKVLLGVRCPSSSGSGLRALIELSQRMRGRFCITLHTIFLCHSSTYILLNGRPDTNIFGRQMFNVVHQLHRCSHLLSFQHTRMTVKCWSSSYKLEINCIKLLTIFTSETQTFTKTIKIFVENFNWVYRQDVEYAS